MCASNKQQLFSNYFEATVYTIGFTLGLCKMTVSPVGKSSFLFHSPKVTAII